MKSKILAILAIVVFFGCNRKVLDTPVTLRDSVNTSIRIVKDVKEVQLPPDSAWLKALLKCDSLGNVYLAEIENLQGERVSQNLTLSENTINIKATDTGKKFERSEKSDSVKIVYHEKPVKVPYPVYTNELTQWQIFQMWLGRIAAVALFAFVAYKCFKGKLSNVSKLFQKLLNYIKQWQK